MVPGKYRISAIAVTFAVAMLMTTCAPASALDRNEGDFWAYSTIWAVPGLDIASEGLLRYEVVSQESISVGGIDVPVNVLRVSGSASASIPEMEFETSMVIEGYLYESRIDMSTARSDLTYWTNVSWGAGDYSLPLNSATRTVTTFSPALLSGFDLGDTVPGAVWAEEIQVHALGYNATSGTLESNETITVSIDYSADTELERIQTGVGEYDTLRITAAYSDGGQIEYWWSEEIGLFVKEEVYVEGQPEPVQSMTLTNYSGAAEHSIYVFIGAGGVALAIALLVLFVVLVKRRPPRQKPSSSPPFELLPPPP